MNSDEVREQWAARSGEYSPAYYAYRGPDERSEAVRERLERHLDADAAILELGCSSGRHLSHLQDHGFTDLTGIELNPEAFDVMDETYPDLSAAGTFHCAPIEDVVEDVADDRFDAVYSVETLQHVHPDAAWVFDELVRITDDLLVTVENEGDDAAPRSGDHEVNYVTEDVPLYYRDWNRVFTERGMTEVHAEEGKRDTVRAFRHDDS